jgi:hypothetical protein
LSLGEEGALGIALDVTSFDYVPNIDSFVLCDNRVLYELNIRRVWRGFEMLCYHR